MRSLNPANQELTTKVVLPKNGYLTVEDDIGLGIEWSEKALASEEQIILKYNRRYFRGCPTSAPIWHWGFIYRRQMGVGRYMDLLQLKYFCALAKNEHLTMTARELMVSAPSLSLTIKKLEKELDAELLDRNGRDIRLND